MKRKRYILSAKKSLFDEWVKLRLLQTQSRILKFKGKDDEENLFTFNGNNY